MRASLLALLLAPVLGHAASLEGRISLVVEGKPLRAEEAASAVVYFRPATPTALQPSTTEYAMSTERKQFVPLVLPIVVGSSVPTKIVVVRLRASKSPRLPQLV